MHNSYKLLVVLFCIPSYFTQIIEETSRPTAESDTKLVKHLTIKVNLFQECETLLSNQVATELEASYVYLAMAHYFGRVNVSLNGFSKFFKHSSQEEQQHAGMLLDYLASRGGDYKLKHILAPKKQEWSSSVEALQDALALEIDVNEELLKIHKCAAGPTLVRDDSGASRDSYDPHLTNFLEETLLREQVQSMRELAEYIARLNRFRGDSFAVGEQLLDSLLADKFK